jgi:hypothetical protein
MAISSSALVYTAASARKRGLLIAAGSVATDPGATFLTNFGDSRKSPRLEND